MNGHLSVSYVFTLLMLLEFDVPETLFLALVSAAVQTFWKAKSRPEAVHLLFNLGCISLTVSIASWIYRQLWSSNPPQTELLRIVLAGSVYFVVNTLAVSIVVALTERRGVSAVWRESYLWAFPYYLVGASAAEVFHLSIARLGWTFAIALLPLLYLMYRSYKIYFAKLRQEMTHAENMASLHLRTIEALAMAIEAKDESTYGHLRRVQVYCLKIAGHLQLSPEECQALQAASILHDIGKLAVPDYIISKPGKLTPQEFEKMKVHTIVGASILQQVGFPYEVPSIVRSHHERWDGKGYPDGLKGEQIPMGARILAVVDCLDALASDRQYRRALPLDEAMDYVASLSGQQFDPAIVQVLQEHYRQFEQCAQQVPLRVNRLDKHAVVVRGIAPGAGFQAEWPSGNNSGLAIQTNVAPLALGRQEMESVLKLTQGLGRSLRVEETLSLIAERLKLIIPFDCIAFYLSDGQVLKPKYVSGEGSRTFATLKIPLGQGLSGWVVENEKPILNGNPSVEPGYLNDPSVFSVLGSALSIPLTGEQLSGALTLYRLQTDGFNRDELRLLSAVGPRIAQGLEDALHQHRTRRDDISDELTGLPNGRALCLSLQDEIARCAALNRPLTVVVCNVDELDHIVDCHGRHAAQELLRRVARILENSCRESDYVGLASENQFVVLLKGLRPDDFESRLEALDRAVRLAGRELCGEEKAALSMGIACYPEHGADADTLLLYAENEVQRLRRARKAALAGNVVQLPRSIISVA